MQLPVAERREVGVVGDDDYRLPELLAKVEEELMNLLFCRGIEVACRFVGQQDGGVIDKRPRDRNALLLSARELGRAMVQPVPEPHPGQHLFGRRLHLGLGPPSGDHRRNHYVFECGKLGQKVMGLKNKADFSSSECGKLPLFEPQRIFPVNPKLPAVRGHQRTEYLKKSRFPGAGCAHYRDDLSFLRAEIHPLQHLQGAERLMNSCCLDYHFYKFNKKLGTNLRLFPQVSHDFWGYLPKASIVATDASNSASIC